MATWTEPTATDDSGVMPIRTRSHNPGAFFAVGTTPVTYTFRDGAGNSDTCIFDVIVVGRCMKNCQLINHFETENDYRII